MSLSFDDLLLDGSGGEDEREGYFWSRPNLYSKEKRIYNVPIMRLINSVLITYTAYIGIYFICGLCTYASQLCFSISLLICCSYWVWATWWDERHLFPPTWSGVKMQRFHPIWIIIWLSFFAIMVAFAVFLMMTSLVITYADYSTAFQWHCWGSNGRPTW